MKSITRPTLRAAIDRKCRDCTYDPACPGTWREQVAQCSSPSCPLWSVRPEPRTGPFAHPPRDPQALSPEWLKSPIGVAVSPPPLEVSAADSGWDEASALGNGVAKPPSASDGTSAARTAAAAQE
jgi:hypothetical protein